MGGTDRLAHLAECFRRWFGRRDTYISDQAAAQQAYFAGYAQAEADAKQDNEPDDGLPYCTCIGCREAQQAEADAAK